MGKVLLLFCKTKVWHGVSRNIIDDLNLCREFLSSEYEKDND